MRMCWVTLQHPPNCTPTHIQVYGKSEAPRSAARKINATFRYAVVSTQIAVLWWQEPPIGKVGAGAPIQLFVYSQYIPVCIETVSAMIDELALPSCKVSGEEGKKSRVDDVDRCGKCEFQISRACLESFGCSVNVCASGRQARASCDVTLVRTDPSIFKHHVMIKGCLQRRSDNASSPFRFTKQPQSGVRLISRI